MDDQFARYKARSKHVGKDKKTDLRIKVLPGGKSEITSPGMVDLSMISVTSDQDLVLEVHDTSLLIRELVPARADKFTMSFTEKGEITIRLRNKTSSLAHALVSLNWRLLP